MGQPEALPPEEPRRQNHRRPTPGIVHEVHFCEAAVYEDLDLELWDMTEKRRQGDMLHAPAQATHAGAFPRAFQASAPEATQASQVPKRAEAPMPQEVAYQVPVPEATQASQVPKRAEAPRPQEVASPMPQEVASQGVSEHVSRKPPSTLRLRGVCLRTSLCRPTCPRTPPTEAAPNGRSGLSPPRRHLQRRGRRPCPST